jgi:hypothetical protein
MFVALLIIIDLAMLLLLVGFVTALCAAVAVYRASQTPTCPECRGTGCACYCGNPDCRVTWRCSVCGGSGIAASSQTAGEVVAKATLIDDDAALGEQFAADWYHPTPSTEPAPKETP